MSDVKRYQLYGDHYGNNCEMREVGAPVGVGPQ